jgi:hypothetical protein
MEELKNVLADASPATQDKILSQVEQEVENMEKKKAKAKEKEKGKEKETEEKEKERQPVERYDSLQPFTGNLYSSTKPLPKMSEKTKTFIEKSVPLFVSQMANIGLDQERFKSLKKSFSDQLKEDLLLLHILPPHHVTTTFQNPTDFKNRYAATIRQVDQQFIKQPSLNLQGRNEKEKMEEWMQMVQQRAVNRWSFQLNLPYEETLKNIVLSYLRRFPFLMSYEDRLQALKLSGIDNPVNHILMRFYHP